MGVNWSRGTDLPSESAGGQIITMGSKIAYGGGTSEYVYCYDNKDEKWNALPPPPVKLFGMGVVIDAGIVAVGGKTKDNNSATNAMYVFNLHSTDDEESVPNLQWSKEVVPPMPTARYSSTVVASPLGLIVIGGCINDDSETNTIEMLNMDTLQWHTTDPLPTPCHGISATSTMFQDRCYVVGGYRESSALNQVFCASTMDLVTNADPSFDIDDDGFSPSRDTQLQSAWQALPTTPIHNPAACILAHSLIIAGENEKTPNIYSLFAFSKSTNSWVYVTDLPAIIQRPIAITNVSNTKLLVISGSTFFRGQLTVMDNEILGKGDRNPCTIL